MDYKKSEVCGFGHRVSGLVQLETCRVCRYAESLRCKVAMIKLRSVFMKIRPARTPHNQMLQFPLRIRPAVPEVDLKRSVNPSAFSETFAVLGYSVA
jgi:hypothetical protein